MKKYLTFSLFSISLFFSFLALGNSENRLRITPNTLENILYPQFDGNPCESCIQTKCQTEVMACVNTASCYNGLRCMSECPNNDQTCLKGCYDSMDQEGQGRFRDLIFAIRTRCSNECR